MSCLRHHVPSHRWRVYLPAPFTHSPQPQRRPGTVGLPDLAAIALIPGAAFLHGDIRALFEQQVQPRPGGQVAEHPQVAADVCVKWRISKSLTVAIALHHTPSRFEHNPLACVLHAADATAMMSGIGTGIEGSLYNIDEKAMEFLSVDDDMLGLLMVDAAGYMKRTMECF